MIGSEYYSLRNESFRAIAPDPIASDDPQGRQPRKFSGRLGGPLVTVADGDELSSDLLKPPRSACENRKDSVPLQERLLCH